MVLYSSWMAGETRSQSTKFVMQLFFTKIETFLNGKETLNPSVHPSNSYLLRTYHVFWLKGGIVNKSENLTFSLKIPRKSGICFKTIDGPKSRNCLWCIKTRRNLRNMESQCSQFSDGGIAVNTVPGVICEKCAWASKWQVWRGREPRAHNGVSGCGCWDDQIVKVIAP